MTRTMKSPFRFGARKSASPDYQAPPAADVDAWAMLRGPTDTAPDAPEAGRALPKTDREADRPAEAAPAATAQIALGPLRQPHLPARVGALKPAAAIAAAYAGPNRIETWRDHRSVDTLGRPAEPHRLRLHLQTQSPPLGLLFEPGYLPEHVTTAHRSRILAPATEFYAVPGHELGGLGLLAQGGRVLVNDAVQPAALNAAVLPDRLAMPEAWTGALLSPDAEIIETDAAVGVALHPDMGYGRFLLEMLPRLLLLAHLRALGRPLPLAVPSDAPQWLRDFVALLFDAGETIRYDSRRQRIRAPCFVLPSVMHDSFHFHPELSALLEALLARVVGPRLPMPRPPGRLCLSRRFLGGWHGADNEAEVEQAMRDIGFTTVHPQDVPPAEQLAMYAGAECIVADYGPAAHNALFAPRGASVVCVDWRDRAQSGIAALRGQVVGYLPTRAGFSDPAQPRPSRPPLVDCTDLQAMVIGVLKLARERRGE